MTNNNPKTQNRTHPIAESIRTEIGVFKNPFGDCADGTRSAAMMERVGGFLLGLVGRERP